MLIAVYTEAFQNLGFRTTKQTKKQVKSRVELNLVWLEHYNEILL